MSRRPVLALIAAPLGGDAGGLELLRLVAALVAHGQPVRLALLEGVPAPDVDDGALDEEVERHLDALRAFDVVPTPLADADLPAAVAASAAVLRHGAPERSGLPVLLALDGATAPAAVRSAGQVLLARPDVRGP